MAVQPTGNSTIGATYIQGNVTYTYALALAGQRLDLGVDHCTLLRRRQHPERKTRREASKTVALVRGTNVCGGARGAAVGTGCRLSKGGHGRTDDDVLRTLAESRVLALLSREMRLFSVTLQGYSAVR